MTSPNDQAPSRSTRSRETRDGANPALCLNPMLKLIVERGKSRSRANIAIARFVSQKCAALVSTCAEPAATRYSSRQAETKLDGAGCLLESNGFRESPAIRQLCPLSPSDSDADSSDLSVDRMLRRSAERTLPTHICAMAGGIGHGHRANPSRSGVRLATNPNASRRSMAQRGARGDEMPWRSPRATRSRTCAGSKRFLAPFPLRVDPHP